MSYVDPSILTTYEQAGTATVGRSLDQNLWDMMLAENLIFNMITKGTTTQPKIEWEYSKPNPKQVQSLNVASGITGSGSNTVLKVSASDFLLLQNGTILKNRTRATLIGTTYVMMDEELIVTSTAGGASNITVARDYGTIAAGTGSTAHADNDYLEILYTPLSEGSLASASPNKYVKVGEASNTVAGFDFKLECSGDVFARGMIVAKDNLQTQYENRMIELRNQIASMIQYGYQKTASDSVLPNSAGLASFMGQSGGNVDYTSTVLTPAVLNNLFATIRNNGGSPTDPYTIFCAPAKAQTISTFGEDKVRLSQEQTRYGRQIREFMSDLGFVASIVDEPTCSPSNLFVVNRRKAQLLTFRPFQKWEWGAYTSNPNGDDAYHQRTYGSMGMKVVDPLTAHGMCAKLAW